MHSFKPLFIIGNPRSGTSLLRVMLTSHPSICIPPECGFIQWWHEKYKDWKVEFNQDKLKLESNISDIQSSRKFETWNLKSNEIKEVILVNKPTNYSEISLCIIAAYAQNQKKEAIYLGDKNNYYLGHLSLINSIFPDAKFVFIVRDGRDVACSYLAINKMNIHSIYKPNLPHDINEIAKEWVANNHLMNDFIDENTARNIFLLKYEDLVKETKSSLSDLCNFLEISFSEKMLTYYQQQLEPVETIEWKRKTIKPPDENGFGKYKSVLTRNEIDIFNDVAELVLERYRYI